MRTQTRRPCHQRRLACAFTGALVIMTGFVGLLLKKQTEQRIQSRAWAEERLAKTSNVTDTNVSDTATQTTRSNSVCTENPYAPSLNTTLDEISKKADSWLESLGQHLTKANSTSMTQHSHERFFPFEEMSACDKACVGGACRSDRGKIVCGIETLKEGCVVYSIGGNNKWQFEKELLQRTPCEIHTFDCTGPSSRFQKPDNDRLVFHHICLGAEPAVAPPDTNSCESWHVCGETMTLEGIQKMLGHERIDLLKMDIEGFEWPLFESWPTLSDPSSLDIVLPFQVLVELHYQTQFTQLYNGPPFSDYKSAQDLVMLQARLLEMGYSTIIRDDNRKCRHCSELTLVRFRCPTQVAKTTS